MPGSLRCSTGKTSSQPPSTATSRGSNERHEIHENTKRTKAQEHVAESSSPPRSARRTRRKSRFDRYDPPRPPCPPWWRGDFAMLSRFAFRVFRVFLCFVGYAIAATSHVPAADDPIFIESAGATGLTFTHANGADGNYYLPEMMGAGVALFDYDNDGDLDVFLVQSGALTKATPGRTSRLFRNDLTIGPDGRRRLRFTDVTDRSGAGVRGYGMGAAVGDYDNDGYLDLLVTSFGSIALLHNNGNGTFSDVTGQSGIGESAWSTSAAFFDYDRDGYLDLFVARYVDFTPAANKLCNDAVGTRDYCSPRVYRPVPARLFRNDGRGHFADV